MITDEGLLKISDWGLSHLARVEAKHANVILSGSPRESVSPDDQAFFGGTLPYMPPEVLRGELILDVHTDVWSFGVVLFEILTGRRPFQGRNAWELREAILRGYARWPAGVDQKLVELTSRCLSLDPASRPKDFIEVRHELDRISDTAAKLDIAPVPEHREPAQHLMMRAHSLLQLGHETEAWELIQKGAPEKPGIVLWEDKELGLHFIFDKSISERIETMTTNDPSNGHLWCLGAWMYQEMDRFEEALMHYYQAIALSPADVDALIGKGKCLMKLERYEDALVCFDQVLALPLEAIKTMRLAQSRVIAMLLLANVLDVKCIFLTHRSFEEVDPSSAMGALTPEGVRYAVRWGQITCLDALGRRTESHEALGELVADIGELRLFFHVIGSWDDKRYYGSVEDLDMPTSALIQLGHIAAEANQHKEALIFFRRAAEIDPEDSIAWYNVGTSEFALDHKADALEAFDRAVEIDPNFATAWNSQGNVLLHLNRIHEAWEAFDKAIEADAEYAKPWLNKAGILMSANQPKQALKLLEVALAIDPRYEKAKQAMEICREMMRRRF